MKPNPITMKNEIMNFWKTHSNGAEEPKSNEQLDELIERQNLLSEQLAQHMHLIEILTTELNQLKYKLLEADKTQEEPEKQETRKSKEQIYREHTDRKAAWNKHKRGRKPTLTALWGEWAEYGHREDLQPRFNHLFQLGLMSFEDYQIWKEGRE